PPTTWLVLPFVAYAVWRYRTADIEYLARQEFIQALLCICLFLAVVSNLYGQTEGRMLTGVLVFLAMFVAMYGIYQWMSGSGKVWAFSRPGYEGRGSGTFISPNHLAGFLEMLLPLAIAFTVFRGHGALLRIFFGYASLVILVGLAATGSRAGWVVGGITMMLFSLLLLKTRKDLWIALAVMLVVAGTGKLLYSKMLQPRLHQPQTGQFITEDIRVELWATSLKMWKDHPLFGVGPAHFDYRYRGYRPAHWRFQPRPGWSHNDYLNTLVDWGVTGLALILLPLGVASFGAVRSWRYLRRTGEKFGNRAAMVAGASLGLTALIIHSFFDFNMHIPANALLAAVLVAVITAHWRFATQRFWLRARWPVQIIATVLLGAAAVYLGREALFQTRQVRALRGVERLPASSPERVEALKRAFALDPRNGDVAYDIGEQLRLRASMGADGYKSAAIEAIDWLGRAQKLNKWNPHPLTAAGMCLDWLDRHDEAEASFKKALQLDPNHWFSRGMMGWHYFQTENYEQVRYWMERSLELDNRGENTLAYTYLNAAAKLQREQKATGTP
ncbi:MAG TPA: O-antigen ligase family protein, partial [Methylomirabilota bacterium]|nr:O-antigen ligase family protein [Methylomirabilota bacterium]